MHQTPATAKAATSKDLESTPDADSRKRVTVLISGSGSNLQALIDASLASPSRLAGARISHVISNRSNAYGLIRASTSSPSISTSVLALKTFLTRNGPSATRADYDVALADLVLSTKPDLIVLAGFMHILSPSFLDLLGPSTPIINLHPALPGAFDGADAIGRAYAAFQKGELENGRTGVMVHRVVKEVDRGEPLVVREVPVKEGESLEELEARIHSIEHELIVEGARKVLEEIKAAAGKKDASATSGLEETLEKLSVGGDEKKTVALEKEKKEEEKETSASQ